MKTVIGAKTKPKETTKPVYDHVLPLNDKKSNCNNGVSWLQCGWTHVLKAAWVTAFEVNKRVRRLTKLASKPSSTQGWLLQWEKTHTHTQINQNPSKTHRFALPHSKSYIHHSNNIHHTSCGVHLQLVWWHWTSCGNWDWILHRCLLERCWPFETYKVVHSPHNGLSWPKGGRNLIIGCHLGHRNALHQTLWTTKVVLMPNASGLRETQCQVFISILKQGSKTWAKHVSHKMYHCHYGTWRLTGYIFCLSSCRNGTSVLDACRIKDHNLHWGEW